ncbi:MAG: aminodeoxychorismate synthase component I [Candidatus Omnitrophota bacterium]
MIPIIEELYTDKSPLEIYRTFDNDPYRFFLDSSQVSAKLGRWSFIGSAPFAVFESRGASTQLAWENGKVERKTSANPFDELRSLFERFRCGEVKDPGIPFCGGGVGYFSYDLKNFIEELPDLAADDLRIADCVVGLYGGIIAYDNIDGRCFAVANGYPETSARQQQAAASRRLIALKEKIRRPVYTRPSAVLNGSAGPIRRDRIRSNFTRSSYRQAIDRAKEYIKKGDIYQVNLSQRFSADIGSLDPFELYQNLRTVSPAPFSAYLGFGDVEVLSSSPERFIKKRGSRIETRPIKGTRPRGTNARLDAVLERELLASEKDAAEHVMIVDLERNDLGRICEYGSVRPSEFIALERYSTVFHLVSTVTGALRGGVTPVDCLAATFPGGSITGAPKVRAMEIIEELEPVKRSIYTGSIGYIGFDGSMDSSIVIRTALVKDGTVYFNVGGGIVTDSDPDKEYQETLDKAEGMFRALRASGVGARPRKKINAAKVCMG